MVGQVCCERHLLLERETPVGIDAEDKRLRGDGTQNVGKWSATAGHVVRVHRLDQ